MSHTKGQGHELLYDTVEILSPRRSREALHLITPSAERNSPLTKLHRIWFLWKQRTHFGLLSEAPSYDTDITFFRREEGF